MKSYLYKTLATLAVIVIAHICIILTVPALVPAEYWVRETIAVKEAIAASLPSPRIVFLAGSSALFAVDAKQIEATTGIPAVNLGLHAGMRLDRLLGIGNKVTRPGDVLVMALERAYYNCPQQDWDSWQLRNSLAWDREYFETIPLPRRISMALSSAGPTLMFDIAINFAASRIFPTLYTRRQKALASSAAIMARFRSGAERPNSFAYSAFNLDNRGDMQHIKGSFTVDPAPDVREPGAVCPETLNVLRQFVTEMKKKNIRVIFSHEPYMVDGKPEAGWQQAEAAYAHDVHTIGAELLEGRDTVFFPRKLFFNFFAHLNDVGRRQRTQQIIKDLERLGVVDKEGGLRGQ